MVESMNLMATSFRRFCAPPAVLSAPDPAAGHCRPRLHRRLLDTHGHIWVSLLWGHCPFLLGPGVHKVLFVRSKSLFPQSCVIKILKSKSYSQKFCNQIPLASKVKFPGGSQSLCQIPSLGNLKLNRSVQLQDLQDLLELTPKRDVLFIIGDWNAKVGSQETSVVTGT